MAQPRNVATGVEIAGIKHLLRVLNKLPKDLQNDVRAASTQIATDLLNASRNAAHTRQQQLAASAVKIKRDRVPAVRVGRAAVRKGVRGTDVFYGAEFGGQRRPTTMQFPPHQGQRGYFLYPTLRARSDRYFGLWIKAIDTAFKQWDYRASKGDA